VIVLNPDNFEKMAQTTLMLADGRSLEIDLKNERCVSSNTMAERTAGEVYEKEPCA
jgi:hypothetical protein